MQRMTESETANTWTLATRSIAQNRGWALALVGLGTLSSAIYPHPPLVGFAAVAGSTLRHRKAIMTMAIVWLFSQSIGYGIRQYPHTGESLAWGLVMGIGTLLVTLLGLIRPRFSQVKMSGHFLWVGLVAMLGFAIFEGLIMGYGKFLGIEHVLSVTVLSKLALKEGIWTIALTSIHWIWARSISAKLNPSDRVQPSSIA